MRKLIKINALGKEPEAFHSLKTFFEVYPQYKKFKENINTYLSRKKTPITIDDFTLYRITIK